MPKATNAKRDTKKEKAAAKKLLKLRLPAHKPQAQVQVGEEEEESSDSSEELISSHRSHFHVL